MVDTSLPFAQALLSIGQDTKQEEAFLNDFSLVQSVFEQNPDLEKVLIHPGIPTEKKEALLLEIFQSEVSPSFVDFLKIVCRHHMAGQLLNISMDYQKLLDDLNNIQTVHVESATPLSEEQQAKLIQRLEKKLGGLVRLECTVNPKLIAGFTVRTEGAVMDASYLGMLDKMKEQLLKS